MFILKSRNRAVGAPDTPKKPRSFASVWSGAIAACVLLGTAVCAHATTYYLDPNGSDTAGNGTIGSPWKTLYKAGQMVPANQGHILHLKQGTYLLDSSLNPGGFAGTWINPGVFIEGENTATDRTKTVILCHQGSSFPGYALNISSGNFETTPGGIKNLTLDGDNFTGNSGLNTQKISNFTVDNVSFLNFAAQGLTINVTGNGTHTVGSDVSGNEVKNSYFYHIKKNCLSGDGWMNSSIHDCYMDNSDIPNASLSNPSPWGDCINIFYIGSTRIYNNTLFAPNYTPPYTDFTQQQTGDTICFFYASGGNEIDHNECAQWLTLVGSTTLNGYDKIVKVHDNHIYFTADVAGSAIELMCNDSDIYNNYIDNCEIGVLTDPGAVGDGDHNSDITNVRVFNNVFRRTYSGVLYEGYGIAFRNKTNTTANNWAIYNNIFDGFDHAFQLDSGGIRTNLNVKNNVVLNSKNIVHWGNPTDPITNSNFTNNVWHFTESFDKFQPPASSANVIFANNLPGATSSLSAPSGAGLNLSGALPNPFYAPTSASSLVVDTGTASISPSITLTGFSGSAPDIGVYEWTGAAGTPNTPPTVATAATANPNPVTTGTTTALSVVGADNGGEANLTYSWATTGTPPASVSFSGTGTNAAKNVTATFTKAGVYGLRVTIRDTGGLTVTSDVSVTVQSTATSLTITPASVTLTAGTTQTFTAVVKDQFGTTVTGATVSWSANNGTITAGGLYTAPSTAGSATVTAQSGTISKTAAVTITAPQPPAAPSGLTATAGNAQVVLSWGASAGATGYTVKRSTTNGGPYTSVVSGVTGTTYTNTGLTNGTTYYYVVTAQNANGSSANSNQASATPVAPQPPAAPTGLTATGGNTQVSLSWTASAGATGYTVSRSTTNGGPYTAIQAGITGTTYSNTGLTNGTTYYYVVTAQNANGSSANSNQASATPAAVIRYEAENGTLNGAPIDTSRAGYSGTGYAAIGYMGGVTWSNVSVTMAGARTLKIRQTARDSGTRSIKLWVNGVVIKQMQLVNNGGVWLTSTETITLNAGTNTIAIKADGGDSAGIDLDYIEVQ